jgi:hypothetical protein
MTQSDTTKNKGGRPEFPVNDNMRMLVAALHTVGTPLYLICVELHMAFKTVIDRPPTEKTLRKVFKKELKNANQIATARVGRNIFFTAIGGKAGAMTAAKHWMNTKGAKADPDWKDQTPSPIGAVTARFTPGRKEVEFTLDIGPRPPGRSED